MRYERADVWPDIDALLAIIETMVAHPLDHEEWHRWPLPPGATLPGPAVVTRAGLNPEMPPRLA